MAKPRLAWAVAVALVLVGVSVLVTRTVHRSGGDRRTSVEWPGGGRLVLWKASFGTNHVLQVGSLPALDPLRRSQPWIRRWIGPECQPIVDRASGDGMSLFYSAEDAAGSSVDDPPWARRLVDQHGCQLALDQGRGQIGLGGTNYAMQESLFYPRRAREFDVVFGGNYPSTNEVTLRIRNPRPWSGKEWVAEPVPCVREQDGLKVIFLGFGAPVPPATGWPQFRVEDGSAEPSTWKLERLWVSDVTGNRAQGTQLCWHEPAWRLEASFIRVPESRFGPDEAFTIHEGPLPADGQALEVREARTLSGVGVQVLAVGGPGAFNFENRGGWRFAGATNSPTSVRHASLSTTSRNGVEWATVRRSTPWAALVIDGVRPDDVWKLVVRDRRGRFHVGSGWSGTGRMLICDLALPKEVEAAESRFVLQRLRTFQFTVAPPVPVEAKP